MLRLTYFSIKTVFCLKVVEVYINNKECEVLLLSIHLSSSKKQKDVSGKIFFKKIV